MAMTENRTVIHETANGTHVTYEQYFDWDSKQKGLVLSSFFYGYITTQVKSLKRLKKALKISKVYAKII